MFYRVNIRVDIRVNIRVNIRVDIRVNISHSGAQSMDRQTVPQSSPGPSGSELSVLIQTTTKYYKRATKYYATLRSTTQYYKVLQNTTMYCKRLKSTR